MRSIALRTALALALVLAAAAPASAVWIGFNPSETVPTTESFTVDLVLDTEGETVMGVDVLFTFDPAVVRLDSVTVGDWFTTAVEPHFFWSDPATLLAGDVHVTGSVMTTGRDGAGSLAVLHFTALAAGFSPLEFLFTDLRDPLNGPVPHVPSTGDRIVIEEAIATDAVSFGGLKAAWR